MGRPDFDDSAPVGSSGAESVADSSIDYAYFGAGNDGNAIGLVNRSDDNISTVFGTQYGDDDGAP